MILQGISGIQFGDGAGGKVALSITERVQRILSDEWFTYMSATVNNPNEIHYTGTVWYRKPEILAPTNYEAMVGESPQVVQAGQVGVNIDTRRGVKYEMEDFDLARIKDVDALVGQVAAGLAIAIRADLNAQFWLRVRNLFATGQTLQNQKIELEFLGTQQAYTQALSDKLFNDLMTINYKINRISQTFNKHAVGVAKSEVMSVVSLDFDTSLMEAFRYQPNSIGEWQVAPTLVGKKVGNFKFITDAMFDTSIPLKQSFNTDYKVDLAGVIGVLFHNEAFAFPMSLDKQVSVVNVDNGNIRFIQKWQFGFACLRPDLAYIMLRKNTTLPTVLPTDKQTQ